jgi:macrolide-specific efflux system membrane fusion protein
VGVARKWIFPIVRILVFVVIAAALVKIAFFADPTQESAAEVPTGAIVEPQVAATVGTILNDVTVQGTVSADAARPILANLAGEVTDILAPVGTTVAVDDRVYTIRQANDPVIREDGTVAPTTYKTSVVRAEAAGVISSLAVIKGQTVAVGDATGQIAPPSFNVSADPANRSDRHRHRRARPIRLRIADDQHIARGRGADRRIHRTDINTRDRHNGAMCRARRSEGVQWPAGRDEHSRG